MPIRVAVLEDDPQVSRRLSEWLESSPRHELAWMASSLGAAGAHLLEHFDLLLLDLGLPDGRGTSLIPLVRARAPQAVVVAFTVFDDEANVIDAIEAGVDGYALKDVSAEVLAETLDCALRGESPISPAVAGYLLKRLRRAERAGVQTTTTAAEATAPRTDRLMQLTPREREVLEVLARGLSYREAAEALGIGANTVAHHVKNLYPKLAANSRSEAIYNAVRDGVIKLPGIGG